MLRQGLVEPLNRPPKTERCGDRRGETLPEGIAPKLCVPTAWEYHIQARLLGFASTRAQKIKFHVDPLLGLVAPLERAQ